jgi:hypothetical protein
MDRGNFTRNNGTLENLAQKHVVTDGFLRTITVILETVL